MGILLLSMDATLCLHNINFFIVGDLQLRAVILHKKVQEDPSIPLQKPQEEVGDLGREVDPTEKIIK
jgi:hypothetical protein